jgi:coenzyme PQQ biosynthesis protein PqqD
MNDHTGHRIALDTVVRLAPRARVKVDRITGDRVLLYPEQALVLSDSAARIADLCRAEISVAAIIDRLVSETPGTSRERIEADVLGFLGALRERVLLVIGAMS